MTKSYDRAVNALTKSNLTREALEIAKKRIKITESFTKEERELLYERWIPVGESIVFFNEYHSPKNENKKLSTGQNNLLDKIV